MSCSLCKLLLAAALLSPMSALAQVGGGGAGSTRANRQALFRNQRNLVTGRLRHRSAELKSALNSAGDRSNARTSPQPLAIRKRSRQLFQEASSHTTIKSLEH